MHNGVEPSNSIFDLTWVVCCVLVCHAFSTALGLYGQNQGINSQYLQVLLEDRPELPLNDLNWNDHSCYNCAPLAATFTFSCLDNAASVVLATPVRQGTCCMSLQMPCRQVRYWSWALCCYNFTDACLVSGRPSHLNPFLWWCRRQHLAEQRARGDDHEQLHCGGALVRCGDFLSCLQTSGSWPTSTWPPCLTPDAFAFMLSLSAFHIDSRADEGRILAWTEVGLHGTQCMSHCCF